MSLQDFAELSGFKTFRLKNPDVMKEVEDKVRVIVGVAEDPEAETPEDEV